MSKLEDLIRELCPNGVEYRALREVSEMKRGTSVTKKDITIGEIPVISGGKTPAYFCDTFNRTGETITVAGSGAGAGFVQYWTTPIFVCDAFTVKGCKTVLTKYLYYCLSSMQERIYSTKKGGGVPHVHISSIENFKIPVPPLPVQGEIVRILDNFTELTAELTARRKQYNYYRDELLAFAGTGEIIADGQTDRQSVIKRVQNDCGFAIVKLSDIATISRGGNFQKKDFCENGVPCIHYGQIYTKYGLHTDKTIQFISEATAKKQKKAVTNDIIMAVTSENVEDVCKCVAWLGTGEVAVSGHTAIIHHNQNAKYLSYFFHTAMFFAQKRTLAQGTKVIEVTPDKLYKVKIPLPPLAEQERIVAVLDRFDALCNDLTVGLPAEIEARRKQYEYYRDQLLSFKELA